MPLSDSGSAIIESYPTERNALSEQLDEIVSALKERRSQSVLKATDFMMTFVNQPDHVAVILATARMDDLLASLIRYRLLPCPTSKDEFLDGERGVGTFSNRIDLSYRIGLIDSKLSSVLHLFRKIRNAFAHSYTEQKLSDSPHSDRLAELATRARSRQNFETMRSRLDQVGTVSDEMKTFAICAALATANLESATIVTKPVDAPFTYLITYP